MRWIVILGLVVTACGGPGIPTHSGYKNVKFKPWTKSKPLKFDDKNEAKIEGELSYADYKRARWYQLTVPAHGELTVKLEITPPGDAVNEDFDLGLEVYDPGLRVIGKSDKESEDETVGELTKSKTLFDLEPGKYLVHLYLQSRMDTADYVLRASFKSTKAPESKTDFPAAVAFVPSLPMVPLNDDTPKDRYKTPVVITRTRNPKPPPPKPTDPKPVTLVARIVGLSVVGTSTRVTLGRGTSTGAQPTMKAQLNGLKGTFPVECNETTCIAMVNATPDQVRAAGGTATLSP
ncbi:MAG: hypothetical protein ABI867_13695 [Kofleriaceae bacterium]